MKKLCVALLLSSIGFAQTTTEVFLFNLSNTHETWNVGTGKNISNNDTIANLLFTVKNLSCFHPQEMDKQILPTTI